MSKTPAEPASLYERLGGASGVRKIVSDILDKNLSNPSIGHYFKDVDMPKLKQSVFEFFSMGTGGPHQYSGKDMVAAHQGLNISNSDFDQGNDDTIAALKESGVDDELIEDVMKILESMRADIVGK